MRHWTRKHGKIVTIVGLLALIGAPPPQVIHAVNWKVCPPGSVDPTCNFTDLQAAVNAASNGDTLTLTAGVHTVPAGVTITGKNLALAGVGAHLTTVQPSASAPSSTSRVFTIGSNAVVSMQNLTVSNGRVTGNAAGGGILNNGSLTLQNVVVSNNLVDGTSGAVDPSTQSGGGGIANTGSLTVRQSAIVNNRVRGVNGAANAGGGGAGGGGIIQFGASAAMTLENVTIAGNQAVGGDGGQFTGGGGGAAGGGVFAVAGNASINASTITSNTSQGGAGTMFGGAGKGSGGGVAAIVAVAVRNSIIAANIITPTGGSSSGNDLNGAFSSGGFNLIGSNTSATGFTNGVLNDQVGTDTAPLNPQLAGLTQNSQGTLSMTPLPTSPALERGSSAAPGGADPSACPGLDQRGVNRPQGLRCDIGAVEARVQLSVTVTPQPANPVVGQPFNYIVGVNNVGELPLTNVGVSGVLPPQLVPAGPITINPPGAGTPGSLPNVVTIPSLQPNQGVTATVPVQTAPGVAGGTPLTSTFTTIATEIPSPGIPTPVPLVIGDQPVSNLTAVCTSPVQVNQPSTCQASASGTGITYSWNFGDGTTGTGQTITKSYPVSGPYTVLVTATNSTGSQSRPLLIQVNPTSGGAGTGSPSPLTGLTVICTPVLQVGTTGICAASVLTGSPPILYTWNFGDGGIATGPVVTHSWSAAGPYTVTVTAQNPVNSLTGSAPVTVTPGFSGGTPPTGLAATCNPTTLVAGTSTTCIANVTGGSPTPTFQWNFGDGGTGSGPNPTHLYPNPGTYTVTVIATNPAGSVATQIPIRVTGPNNPGGGNPGGGGGTPGGPGIGGPGTPVNPNLIQNPMWVPLFPTIRQYPPSAG